MMITLFFTSLLCLAKSDVVCLVIILNKLAPQCLLRQFFGSRTGIAHLLLGHCRELCYSVLDGICHLRVVVVGAVNNLHAILYLCRMSHF